MNKNISDYDLAHNLQAQKDLLLFAYATDDGAIIEQALLRVMDARRMKKNGTLEWFKPSAD